MKKFCVAKKGSGEMKRRVLCAMFAVLFVLSGCTSQKEVVDIDVSEVGVLPIVDEPITVEWFHPLMNSNVLKSLNDQYCWQEIQERTGINIEWIHPSVGTEKDNLNIAIASRDLPDIITWSWRSHSGGPNKAIEDEVIIKLNDYMKLAPNYAKILEENEFANKNARLDDGSLYGFCHTVENPQILCTAGFIMRKDWLDKLQLSVPKTIDEWYKVLKAFKTQDPNGNGKADEIPYVSDKSGHFKIMSTAFGVRSGFYVDPKTDKVVYGPIQPQYKEYISTMAKWYQEGLIDPDYITNERKNVDAKVLNEQAGAYYGTITSQLGGYITQKADSNPDFALTPVNSPVDSNGISYSNLDSRVCGVGDQCITITTTNPYKAQTVRLLDYIFSEEGRTLTNWGKEGESYEIVDGKKKFTDKILKNPDGLSPVDAIAPYAFPIYGYAGPFDMDSFMSISQQYPVQKEASEVWLTESTDMLMPVLYPTVEESTRYAQLMSEISTYYNEMFHKFVLGKEPVDKFDEYVKTIKQLGIDEAVSILQAQYDRSKTR